MTDEMAAIVEDTCNSLKVALERHSSKTVSVAVLAEVNGDEAPRVICIRARRAAAIHMAIELVTETLSRLPGETMLGLLQIVSQRTIELHKRKKALAERQL